MAASKTARPGRTLAVFFLVLAIVYGLVAIGGSWKPELGLDLRGGTEITMTAVNPGGSVTRDSLDQARDIIDQRVNGSGVASARVTTEGNDVIQVSIPGSGKAQRELADRVSQTAKLRFRFVACDSQSITNCSSAAPTAQQPGLGSTVSPSSGQSQGAQRAPVGFDQAKRKHKKAQATQSATPRTTPTASATPSPSAAASPSASASAPSVSGSGDSAVMSVKDAESFMNNPPADWAARFNSFTCPKGGIPPDQDKPLQPLLTCNPAGTVKYLLTPAIIQGTEISDAGYDIPQAGTQYEVTLDFHSKGRGAFADATGDIAGTQNLFAITLDGLVVSAATAESRIVGSARITGGFSQSEAKALANNLKYGSLPLTFPSTLRTRTDIGPSLAGNQLSAGLLAGAIGLLLVMIFCLLYYRGLGVVVVGSLIVAGAATYGMVLLLSKTAGVVLDLPGIAGLIVAVGITADSFIVYFERIRDEMRDGKSMRVAVDAGWVRARNTCLAADSVSILAALTLYIFASNEVRGFAFMLGLATVIDLVIFFFFTHPLVKLLSGRRFFNRGHKLSGLDAEAVGVSKIALGGRA